MIGCVAKQKCGEEHEQRGACPPSEHHDGAQRREREHDERRGVRHEGDEICPAVRHRLACVGQPAGVVPERVVGCCVPHMRSSSTGWCTTQSIASVCRVARRDVEIRRCGEGAVRLAVAVHELRVERSGRFGIPRDDSVGPMPVATGTNVCSRTVRRTVHGISASTITRATTPTDRRSTAAGTRATSKVANDATMTRPMVGRTSATAPASATDGDQPALLHGLDPTRRPAA